MSKLIFKKVPFSQITSPPVGKASVYIDIDDTPYLVFEDGSRVPLGGGGGGGLNFYPNFATFPVTGITNELYIDKSTGRTYIWDTTSGSYVPISSDAYVRNKDSTRFDDGSVVTTTVETALDHILFPYRKALVTLSGTPIPQWRERGIPISGLLLSAAVIKKSNNILSIKYLKDGTQIFLNSSPPTGTATSTYTYTTAFSTTCQFTVEVNDGSQITTSNTLQYNFTYPVYIGSGLQGYTAAQIQSLTKVIVEPNSQIQQSLSPNASVMYIATPVTYNPLTAIYDPNGNNTISDWIVTTKNFTVADGSTQSYRCYEFQNLTTQTQFLTTFKFT